MTMYSLQTQEQLIITKVKSLANFCLPDKEKAQLIKMFDDPKQNHFILSNEEVNIIKFLLTIK